MCLGLCKVCDKIIPRRIVTYNLLQRSHGVPGCVEEESFALLPYVTTETKNKKNKVCTYCTVLPEITPQF